MKISAFILVFTTTMMASAQTQNTLCGRVTLDSFVSGRAVVIEETTVHAITPAAKEFLGMLSVHGAQVCDSNASREAPFEICYSGDLQNHLAQEVFCGKVPRCRGIQCGGIQSR